MKITMLDLTQIKPYEKNPRKNQKAVIPVAKSIEQFGFKVPIIVDKNYTIVAGHTRYKAAEYLKMTQVPCIIANDLTPTQVKAFRIADNRVGEIAQWDEILLSQELDELKDLFNWQDFNINLDEFQLDKEIHEDDFDIDEALDEIETPKAKRGEIYQLGQHRVMCGDATIQAEVEKLMNGATADLVVTDPPYNVDYGSKAKAINKYGYQFSDRRIMNDYMPESQFIEFLSKAFESMENSLKNGGGFYIFHASITVLEFEIALRQSKLKTRQQLIWVKISIVIGRQDYQWKHEPCLYGWKEGAAHYFLDDRTKTTIHELEKPNFNKMNKDEMKQLLESIYEEIPVTTIHVDKPTRSEQHPTMKPIKLLAQLIQNSSSRGQIVLDLFGGSGSTLIAADQTHRKCYTMELDPKYVDVIIERYEKHSGQKAIKLP